MQATVGPPAYVPIIWLVVIIWAVAGAQRKWKTLLTIVAWMFGGAILVGLLVGIASGNSTLAGHFAGYTITWLGIAAAIIYIFKNKDEDKARAEKARRDLLSPSDIPPDWVALQRPAPPPRPPENK